MYIYCKQRTDKSHYRKPNKSSSGEKSRAAWGSGWIKYPWPCFKYCQCIIYKVRINESLYICTSIFVTHICRLNMPRIHSQKSTFTSLVSRILWLYWYVYNKLETAIVLLPECKDSLCFVVHYVLWGVLFYECSSIIINGATCVCLMVAVSFLLSCSW